jgi:heme/copper-type cytochrome/quinol oxidase subunit 3
MGSKPEHDFHLVNPSPWPIFGAFSALVLPVGGVMYMHDKPFGGYIALLGLFMVLFTMFSWWKQVVREGAEKPSSHTNVVQFGLRAGMALFILSEVMFFFAFFWSFFKAALAPVAMLEGVWPVAEGVWPPEGIEVLDAWDLPLMNTIILLLSGTTVTWAHHALLHDNRKDLITGLTLTVLLGASFTCLQIVEYGHATFGFTDGIYPSNFYMATGFHGFHVLVGTIFLFVCLLRAKKGQFTKKHHLGFEFAAWYWHFVDVVWLFLFIFVYWWGA